MTYTFSKGDILGFMIKLQIVLGIICFAAGILKDSAALMAFVVIVMFSGVVLTIQMNSKKLKVQRPVAQKTAPARRHGAARKAPRQTISDMLRW